MTNYFTYDQNRPLHVFDMDKVKGNLRVHRAKGGETIVALDDKEYTLQAGQMAISDDNGVKASRVSWGGLRAAAQTRLLTSSLRALIGTRSRLPTRAGALKINSDARYRFERGVDPAFTPVGLEHAVRMIVDHAGGEASQLIQAGNVPDVSRSYKLDTDRCSSLVGMEIAADRQRRNPHVTRFRHGWRYGGSSKLAS